MKKCELTRFSHEMNAPAASGAVEIVFFSLVIITLGLLDRNFTVGLLLLRDYNSWSSSPS